MLPGVGKVKDQLASAGLDDKILTRQEAIIQSMTKGERAKPDTINGSRRKRIAAGSGVEVSEVNKLLKMHRQMSDMMKQMRKGGRGALGGLPPGFAGAMNFLLAQSRGCAGHTRLTRTPAPTTTQAKDSFSCL
jgi:signal recognition particle subunit SRP54